METPALLYHYTDARGLIGIVENRCLWATDTRFLNDELEAVYAGNVVSGALESLTVNPEDDGSIVPHVRACVGPETPFSIYVACLCEDGDLLSQWRAYGVNQGYSLGFALRDVARGDGSATAVEEPETRLYPMTYGLDPVAQRVNELVDAIVERQAGHPGMHGYETARRVMAFLASVKHPAFSEEREWRLIQVHDEQGGVQPPAVHFRPSQLGVVPYRKFTLGPAWLQRIVVGPGPNRSVRATGVELLLRAHDVAVEVALSDAPYRY
jgi:Protein of unknown function (DUF2971)